MVFETAEAADPDAKYSALPCECPGGRQTSADSESCSKSPLRPPIDTLVRSDSFLCFLKAAPPGQLGYLPHTEPPRPTALRAAWGPDPQLPGRNVWRGGGVGREPGAVQGGWDEAAVWRAPGGRHAAPSGAAARPRLCHSSDSNQRTDCSE